jgi:fructose transport system substrate-binding protein
MLDLSPNGVSVDVQRDQGFLSGFGIDVANKEQIGDESDPRIVGHDVTNGDAEGGRTAMENLLQKDPSINLVYTINEPAAAGAYAALQAAGKQNDVTIVSVDGGCPGVAAVKAGQLGATSQQYPLKMARRASTRSPRSPRTAPSRRHTAARPSSTPASTLITDQPQDRRRVQGHRLRPAELLGLTVRRPAGRSAAGLHRRPGGPHASELTGDARRRRQGRPRAPEPDTGFEEPHA